ncbi:hyaluronidase PH-20-like [Amia ocellicauda]|uniref:hyaluronidase PH-20-like n=1 Tax=Amia ocellicauda TaxID=2972642 RepID=UPI003463BE65
MKTLLSASCCITFTTITSLISQRIVCLHHHPSTKAHPLYKNTPFAFIFNAPSDPCSEKHDISLDLSQFSAVSSPAASAIDQPLTLFYNNRLGLYPFVNEQTAELHNGGIPQDGNLQRHLEQAAEDISFHISSEKANGLAVIDWEDWRPVWMRNWARKIIYQKLSLDSGEFERAAREFMRETLKLGKTLRPNQRWGFYLFPNCYNHRHILNTNYTGQCPEAERARNDGLHWLWEESTALYPSIYFLEDLKDSWKAALFVRHRVLEAMRVAQRPRRSEPIPVYVYNRPVIVGHTQQFLSQVCTADWDTKLVRVRTPRRTMSTSCAAPSCERTRADVSERTRTPAATCT